MVRIKNKLSCFPAVHFLVKILGTSCLVEFCGSCMRVAHFEYTVSDFKYTNIVSFHKMSLQCKSNINIRNMANDLAHIKSAFHSVRLCSSHGSTISNANEII